MSRRFIRRLSKVPPHVAIILALLGIVGISGAVLLFKHSEPKAEAMVLPRAARLERVDGTVSIAQALNHADNDQLTWQDAVVNAPLTVGDRVWARDNSYAQIAFTGRNYARLNPGTALDVLTLADQRTQLALRSGSALFDVGDLPDGELYEVATPCGAVDFTEPGLYQLGIGDDGNATISVLSGLAQVVGLSGSGQISKGEVLTLAAQVAAQAVASRLAPDTAGNILDDYYGYRYPNRYDHRYRNYDAYLDDPDYYDPYSQSVAYQYLDEDIPGLYDLDEYGDWQDVDGYGRCWAPRVASDWSPYRTGYWDTYDVWGPTWVSYEPWGYAPYHYGRWAYVNQQRWVWVPEDCRRNAAYAPALVAFIPVQQSDIAWVPLAPGERYVPRYYDASYAPRYLESPQVVEQYVSVRNYANLVYPTAVTAVPVQAFTGPINRNVIVPVNRQWIEQAQPVIDPYQVEGVRNIALQQERWQRKQQRQIDAAAFNRPVVTSVAPVVPPVQPNVAQAWQVQAVPEKQKRNKLQVENNGQVVAAQRPDGVPVVGGQQPSQAFAQQRDQRIAELKTRMQQGDRSATQEFRQLKQERKQAAQAQPQPQAWAQQQAQQAPQGMTAKQQRRFERQQQAAQQQQGGAQQQQARQPAGQQAQQQAMTQKQQRRFERQQQAAQQQQQAAQQAQINEQRRAQKQAARQQMMQQQQAQRAQQQQAAQQSLKAQRKAERQHQAQQQMVMQQQRQQAAQAQAAQQRQQMKQQMRMQRQQAAQQQVMQQQAAAQQQMKQQRRAERQQQQMMVQRQQQVMQQQAQQQQMRQQMKQQRRYEQQQQAAPRPQAYQGPPAAQPQSKAERKAARRNQ
jgi:hypothetical protein